MPTPPLSDQLRRHAGYCDEVGAPLYGELMRGFADDVEAGGPVGDLFAPWADAPPGHVVQLRLLGGLHRLVLRREAPLLATHYRSVGGTAGPRGAWPVARAVGAEHLNRLRAELDVAPQTNETGRASALVAGVLHACAARGLHRVRLLELGSSAGLLLRVAHFRVGGEGWAWGPQGSPVDLSGAVTGRLPAAAAALAGGVEVVSARGCDLAPVDPTSEEGRLRLTSFVWPDHVERHERLRGALALAARHPATVDAAPADTWLVDRLGEPADDGVLTVVWHSIVRQYVPGPQWSAVLAAVADARRRGAAVAHVLLESSTAPYDSGPALEVDGAVLGHAPAHGVPLHLEPAG